MRPTDITSEVLSERDVYIDSFNDLPLKELFTACESDPAVFAKYMLGIRLYGWQWLVTRKIVSGERRIILNTSRQIGKSLLSSVLALWYCVFNKGNSSEFHNTRVGIISAGDVQAKKVMDDIRSLIDIGDAYCKLHYSKNSEDLFAKGLFSYLIDESKSAENNKSAITFKSYDKSFGILLKDSLVGSKIKSYPPTNIVRGETFNLLFVDEAAQIDDEIYYYAIEKTGDKFDTLSPNVSFLYNCI